MKCSDVRKILADYLDGVLSQQDRALVEAHLASCKSCSEEFAFLKTYVNEAGSLEKVKAPSDFLEKVHQRLERRFSFEKLMRTLFVPVKIKIPLELAGVAATVLIAFFVARFFMLGQGEVPIAARQMAEKAYHYEVAKVTPPEKPEVASAPSPYEPSEFEGFADYKVAAKGDISGMSSACYIPVEPEYKTPEVSVSGIIKTVEDLKGKVTSRAYDEKTGLLKSIVVEVPTGQYNILIEKLKVFSPIISSAESTEAADKQNSALKIIF